MNEFRRVVLVVVAAAALSASCARVEGEPTESGALTSSTAVPTLEDSEAVDDLHLGACPPDRSPDGGALQVTFTGVIGSTDDSLIAYSWVEILDWDMREMRTDRERMANENSSVVLSAPRMTSLDGDPPPSVVDGDEWGHGHNTVNLWRQEITAGNRLIMELHRAGHVSFVVAANVFSVRGDGSVVAIGPCTSHHTELLRDVASAEGATAAEVLMRTIEDPHYLTRYVTTTTEATDPAWADLPFEERQVFPLAGTPTAILERLEPNFDVTVVLGNSWSTSDGLFFCAKQRVGWSVCTSATAGTDRGLVPAEGTPPITEPDGASRISITVWADETEAIEIWLSMGPSGRDAAALMATIPAEDIKAAIDSDRASMPHVHIDATPEEALSGDLPSSAYVGLEPTRPTG